VCGVPPITGGGGGGGFVCYSVVWCPTNHWRRRNRTNKYSKAMLLEEKKIEDVFRGGKKCENEV
jgi:hypothetical protein